MGSHSPDYQIVSDRRGMFCGLILYTMQIIGWLPRRGKNRMVKHSHGSRSNHSRTVLVWRTICQQCKGGCGGSCLETNWGIFANLAISKSIGMVGLRRKSHHLNGDGGSAQVNWACRIKRIDWDHHVMYGAAWFGAMRYGFGRRVLLSHGIDRTVVALELKELYSVRLRV
jgi:hypothetical protein